MPTGHPSPSLFGTKGSQRTESLLTESKIASLNFSCAAGARLMQKKSDNQLALFIRDERSGRLAFNAQALRALGVDHSRSARPGILNHKR
jgi:hypothetical protein